MAVLNIDDIPKIDEAYPYAMARLLLFMKEVLPSRKMFLAEKDYPTSTDPYLTARPMPISGTPESSYGNDAIYREMDENGAETYIYEYKIPVSLKTYKSDAIGDMLKLRQYLKNKRLWYNFFGVDGIVGVREVTPVTNQPTNIDMQEWENGAVMTVTLSFLVKEIDGGLGDVETVSGTTQVDDIVKDFTSTLQIP